MTVADIVSLYLNKLITRTEARRLINEQVTVGVLNEKIDLTDLYSLDYVGVKR